MRSRFRSWHSSVVVCCLFVVAGCADGGGTASSTAATTSAPTTTVAPSDPLVGRGEVEVVGEGYGFLEGPQWMPDDGVLVFSESDLTRPWAEQPGTIYQLADGDEITAFRKSSSAYNGLALDPQGRLLAAEPGARRVTRTEPDGTVNPIADRFEGARLNEPNDIVVRSDGTIYFTDPLFEQSAAELDFRGVFRIAPNGDLTAERRGAISESPNGVALSPDESLLYVADTYAQTVRVFDVAADGSLSDGRGFATTAGFPDGMTVDAVGNLFVASVGFGIEVFAPDGTRWGTIPLPNPGLDGRQPSNCAFGGADRRTLYITANEVLYRVTLPHPGLY